MYAIAQTNLYKLDKSILRLNQQLENEILHQMEAKLPMKKDEEINGEQTMSQSTSNIEIDNENANLSLSTSYEKNSVTKPSEILMSFILPMVSNRLKFHQEIMKLKESNT